VRNLLLRVSGVAKGVAMVACNVGVVAFKPYDTRAKFVAGSKPFLTLKHDLGESLPCVNHGEKFKG
jgi:hypothetical protein